jgi:hypothetical protein
MTPPSTGDRIDEWIESGLRPNHDWPVHYQPEGTEQVVRTSYKRALSPDMQLEDRRNQYDTWMNLDIFDYLGKRVFNRVEYWCIGKTATR